MTSPSPSDLFARCTFPDLPARYDAALREAVAFILERYDALGIIASGTIVRGTPGENSDLDLYVIQRPAWRQRVQRCFNGVPAELFVNPPQRIAEYFASDRRAGRPITAHMLATGTVILDRDPLIAELIAQARAELDRAPAPSEEDLTFRRYMIATQVEDAADIASVDPQAASMILGLAVHGLLQYTFLAANRWIPRDKDMLAALHALDPVLARHARAFYAAADAPARLPLGERIAQHVIGTDRFFEWESAPEDV